METTHQRSRWRQCKKSLSKHIPTHLKPATTFAPEPQDNSSEANSDNPKPDTAYSPVALEDPKNQIRLLRFVSDVGHSPLTLQTSVWSLNEAPPYVGISYTWGKPNTRTVVIDEEPVRIRFNAYYALRQVQLHHRQIHIWIDSICINQNDDEEKSAQVAIMYQIFEGATHVVSSLGAPLNKTEWLFTVARGLEPLLRRSICADGPEPERARSDPLSPFSESFSKWHKEWQWRRSWDRANEMQEALRTAFFRGREKWGRVNEMKGALRTAFFRGREKPFGQGISTAVRALDKYPYWERLWVVQEVAAARNDVGLLSGPHQVSAIAMRLLIDGPGRNWLPRGVAETLLEIVGSAHGHRLSLKSSLTLFGEFHCSDPRDRLFALVGITDWQKGDCPRIIPDYTKSAWNLALEIGPTLSLTTLRRLVWALEITSKTGEVGGFLQKQRSLVSTQTTHVIEQDAHRHSTTAFGQLLKQIICFRLRATASDDLYADLDFSGRRRYFELHLPPQAADFVRGKGDSQHQIAQPVRGIYGSVAALVCPGARSDDILVPVEGFQGLLLIVRASETNDTHYDIIGQGLLIEQYRPDQIKSGPRPEAPCSCSPEFLARQSVFTADVHVALTIEELIVLEAQHQWALDIREESYIAAGLDRMATKPTTRPRSAVSFSNVSYNGRDNESDDESDQGRNQNGYTASVPWWVPAVD